MEFCFITKRRKFRILFGCFGAGFAHKEMETQL